MVLEFLRGILGGLLVGAVGLVLVEYYCERQWDKEKPQPSPWQQQQAVMRRRRQQVMREMRRIVREHRR